MSITSGSYNTYVSWTVLLCVMSYLVMGIFPMTLFETDATGVLAGCKRILETGRFGENEYTYYFQSQPGIYGWIIGFYQLTGTSLTGAYSITSALFGLLFMLMSGHFIARLLNVGFVASMLCLLLFQEIYSACFYMNSATGAAFFMMAAFCLIYDQHTPARLVGSGLLLALAAWTRLDVAIAFPVIALLLKADTILQRVEQTAVIFAVFITAFGSLCWVSNAHNVFNEVVQGGSLVSFFDNQQTAGSFISSQFVRVLIGYFSVVTVLLMGYGMWLLIWTERWQLLSVCLLPVCLFVVLLGGHLVAGKHLLYYTPFFAVLVLVSCQELYRTGFRRRKLLFKTLLVVAALQYVIGVRVSFSSYPYSNNAYASVRPSPTFGTLASIPSPVRQIDSVQLVIGGGTKLTTSDELLLSSGIVFAPLMWADLKQDGEADYAAILHYLTSFQGDTLHITASQGSAYPIKNLLYLSDYQLLTAKANLNQSGYVYQWTWRKNGRIVVIDQARFPKKSYQAYIQKLTSTPYVSYLHLAFWDWERWYLHRYNRHTDTLRHVGYLFGRKPAKHTALQE